MPRRADSINVAIAATGVTWLSPLVKIGALAGLFSVILVTLMAQPRNVERTRAAMAARRGETRTLAS